MPPHEMRKPEGALDGPYKDEAVELARIWWIHDRPEYVLGPFLKDPKNIGRVLYEAAFHFSQVYASRDLGKADELLAEIVEGWEHAKTIPMATHMTTEAPPRKG
jgi:hypothetical protein